MEDRIIGAGMASYPAGVHLRIHVYRSNLRPALSLICADDFQPYVDLTANVPHIDLAEDEVLIAWWNIPADVIGAVLATGMFAPVRTLAVGCGRGAVWKIQSAELRDWIADARAETAADAPVPRATADAR